MIEQVNRKKVGGIIILPGHALGSYLHIFGLKIAYTGEEVR